MTNYVDIYAREFHTEPIEQRDEIDPHNFHLYDSRVANRQVVISYKKHPVSDCTWDYGKRYYELHFEDGSKEAIERGTRLQLTWTNGYVPRTEDNWHNVYKNSDDDRAIARARNISRENPTDIIRTYYRFDYSREYRRIVYFKAGETIDIDSINLLAHVRSLQPTYRLVNRHVGVSKEGKTAPWRPAFYEVSNLAVANHYAKSNSKSFSYVAVEDETGLVELWYDRKKSTIENCVAHFQRLEEAWQLKQTFLVSSEQIRDYFSMQDNDMYVLNMYILSHQNSEKLQEYLANLSNDLGHQAKVLGGEKHYNLYNTIVHLQNKIFLAIGEMKKAEELDRETQE